MNNHKTLLIAAAFSFRALADSTVSGVELHITSVQQGLWVVVSQSGEPVEGVDISLSGVLGSEITPANGTLFLRSDVASTRSSRVTATLMNGTTVTQRVILTKSDKH
ncbi:hypothetical protein [Enterovibrio nigricans]|uniref:Uncharacterized protein n=1 Tax=Enterovibrio nigricans DSM 22720 TaxID=1121868 RepID=A0A1T4VLT7_9GAMM|nr:hypothetical protein [Enterovibrio nigricans]PKF49476.1 hypothetical protein AT251_18450 [Enterovibrio nigricans]SKA65855.1 hypothetical protein SAMN02745132_04009 [Enterovibrio nigricans DSM 22720]